MKTTRFRNRPVRVQRGAAWVGLVVLAGLGGCGGGGPGTGDRAVLIASEQPGVLSSAAYLDDGSAIIAGGQIGGGGALLLRWDGQMVTPLPAQSAHAFWWVTAIAPNDLLLAGEAGEVHRFDGNTLTLMDAGVPADATLFGIWAASDDEAWAVGGSFSSSGSKRVIRHLSGGQWVSVDSPADVAAETTYFKVWGAGASDVWIVGDGGVVLHWDGSALTRDARVGGAERFLTVHGCDAQNVWIVGGTVTSELRAYDGQTWRTVDVPGAQPLSGVACQGDDAVVSGAFGYAARLTRGVLSAHTIVTPKEVEDLTIHGVARSGAHTLLVGGDVLATAGAPFRGFVLQM